MKIQSLTLHPHADRKSGEMFVTSKTFPELHSKTELQWDFVLKNYCKKPPKTYKMAPYSLSSVMQDP